MLKIHIPERNLWDEEREEFVEIKEIDLQLEHSLISLKKWEQKWHKPFLKKENKTNEEIQDYIRCMTITQNVNPIIYKYLPIDTIKTILEYIDDPMTATSIGTSDDKNTGASRKETITAEVIYYWMITLNIPVQFEKWHLNQLITLIRVVNIKNTPPKKLNKKEQLARYSRLNAERRAKLHSKG